jgi:hypothetical protein
MAHGISDVSNNGYFYHLDDTTQLKTAQRSTFQATASNKISNWFLSKDNNNLQKIGAGLKWLRKGNLLTRRAVNEGSRRLQRLGVQSSPLINELTSGRNRSIQLGADESRRQKLSNIDQGADLKKMRLDLKIKINAAAPADMAQTIERATATYQQNLREMNYRPLNKLSSLGPQKNIPIFMRNAHGHRVRSTDQKLPFVARKVAQMGSHQYENGVTGVERMLKRGAQYGAIGVASGVQLSKQALYSAAAKMTSRNSEERATLLRHAGRARDMRRLNSAALKGNQVFADKFRQIQDEQAITRSVSLEAADYQEVTSRAGVAPAKTRYSARKMNDYFGSDNGANKTKMRKLATGYVMLANVTSYLSSAYHARQVKWASKHEQASTGMMQEIRNYHEARRFNAQFKINTSRAALDGKLKDSVGHSEQSDIDQRDVDDQEITPGVES